MKKQEEDTLEEKLLVSSTDDNPWIHVFNNKYLFSSIEILIFLN